MDIYIQDSSIVFTVAVRNPAMLTIDDLREEGIISEHQEVTDPVFTPFGSRVRYGDGYVFEALEGRVVLLKSFYEEGPIRFPTDSVLPDNLEESATRLADLVKSVGLESVGVNFTFVIPNGSLQNLTHNLPSHAQTGAVGFSIFYKHFVAFYSLTKARKNDLSADEAVLADVNFSGSIDDEIGINARAKVIKGLVRQRSENLQQAWRLLNELPF